MSSQIWTPEPDCEPNQQSTVIDDEKVTLYSNEDGTRWYVEIDGGDPSDLRAGSERNARLEAQRLMEC